MKERLFSVKRRSFYLYAQSCARLNPTIANPGIFGFSLGSSCACINLLRNGDLVLALLSYVAENERTNIRRRQAEGIAAAKARGVHFGRRPNPLPDNFYDVYLQWKMKKLSVSEAAKLCGMPQTTFFERARTSSLAILQMKPSSIDVMCNEKPSEEIPGVFSP